MLSVAWHPSGLQFVASGADGIARIWDLQTLEEVNQLIGHDGAVSDVDWSPDGTQILTASLDQTARVWQVEIEGLLDLAESMILRDPPEFTAQERCLYLHECGE